MNEITNLIERLGYPIAVSIWLMWFVSAIAARLQRLIEWAIAAKHQLNNIELMLQQLVSARPHTQDSEVPQNE